MKLDLKKINPFSKTADQMRDQAGKFTAGSGGLSKLQKLNWKRSLPVVLVVALVGGFLVFRSFAGTKPSAYQYSIKDCSINSTTEADVKCKNESAEALVYRMYQGIFARKPDDAGFKFWVQKMAGDRVTSEYMATAMLNSSEARWGKLDKTAFINRVYEKVVGRTATSQDVATWTPKITDTKSKDTMIRFAAGLQKMPEATAQERMLVLDNKAFIERIFKSMLKRDANYVADPNTSYWLKQLNEKKLTRDQVVVRVAKSSEALRDNSEDVKSFATARPFVEIRQVAKEKQQYREAQAKVYAVDTNNKWQVAVQQAKDAQKNLDNAKATAAKGRIERSDLTSIANEQRSAEDKYKKAAESYNAALKSYKSADTVLQAAKKVTAHSPDIPYSAVETWRNKAAVYSADAKTKALSAKQRISDISAQYKVAEKKYESQCNSGTDYNGNAPGCGTPPPPPAATPGGTQEPAGSCNGVWPQPRSTSEQVKGCQRTLNVSADGIWGCGTEAAFRAKYPNSAHRKECSNLGDGTTGCNDGYVKRGTECVQRYVALKNVDCWRDDTMRLERRPLGTFDYGQRYKELCISSTPGFNYTPTAECTGNGNYSKKYDGLWVYCERR